VSDTRADLERPASEYRQRLTTAADAMSHVANDSALALGLSPCPATKNWKCRPRSSMVFRTAVLRCDPDDDAQALASGSPQNNPRVPTADQIAQLYREVWA